MNLDPKKTVVLTLDIQEGILDLVPEANVIIPNVSKVLEISRKSGLSVFHVGIGFEKGYPEISPLHKRFSLIKEQGNFIKGSNSVKTPASIFNPSDGVIYKHRVSAFSGNSLQMILHSQGYESLVLMGISTSGIVLSTVRAASDMDFQCIVIKDACFDPDEEVHRVLVEKIFPKQATLLTTIDFQFEFEKK